ncbi:MAG: AMP-binding protein [Acidobacteria bacterium]|nr:AMP-binding protein [Acidobacteriota bacterium]
MPTRAEAEAVLTGPGGQFEIVRDVVDGVAMKVYKDRLPSLRSVFEIGAAHADKEHIVFGDRRITFAEFQRLANAVSAGLVAAGVGPGDRVAVLSANNPEWALTFWATVNLGAICVGLNAWWKADEIAYGLEHSGASVLVADRERADRIAGRTSVPTYVIGETFDELLALPDARLPATPIDEGDPAVIFYTSGTTGRPKGSVSTHRSMLATLQNQVTTSAVNSMAGQSSLSASGQQPVSLLTSPLFHVSGCHASLVVGMLAGIKLVIPEGRFEAGSALELIQRERVTLWATVPTMVWRVVEHPDRHRYDLSSVVTVVYGGSPAAGELQRRAMETFPSIRSTGNAYGLTETGAAATVLAGEEALTHPDSVGRPLPNVDVRALDGELQVKGPIVMAGYWSDPDATAAVMTSDGWFRTGDLGHIDDDGYVYVTDRAKDVVIRGGENVYPAEIEERLAAHPAVAEAAVVGVAHPSLGEEVKAIVRLRPGLQASPEELARWVGETLADFKVPAHWSFTGDLLPRNAAGKLLKDVLRGQARVQLTETL